MNNELDLTYGELAHELIEALDLREGAAMRIREAQMQALQVDSEDTELELAEALEAFDRAELIVKEYLKAEVKKADRIIGYIERTEALAKLKREKANQLLEMARAGEAEAAYVKNLTLSVMREMDLKKCEGAAGFLRRQGNGGVQPVEVRQPELLPAKYQRFEVRMSGEDLARILESQDEAVHAIMDGARPADPDKDAIRRDLLKRETCPDCKGLGASHNNSSAVPCYTCHGEKMVGGSVPGAVLLDRGESLRTR
jgi:hypothetical protein